MSWSIRLKLKMLPILEPERVDAQLLKQDICARLGYPDPFDEKVETREAVKVFWSVASAEGYIDEWDPMGFFSSRNGYFWKRIGHCLVLLCVPPVPVLRVGIPPVPCQCVVRIGESVWKFYDLTPPCDDA